MPDDFLTGGLIEVSGRLVGQQEIGLGHQGPRDGRPLHFAARQLPRPMLQPVAQTDHFQQFLGPARCSDRRRK